MKKKVLIGVLILLVAIVVAGVLFRHMMGKPLYEPGMVRAGRNLRASLEPPAQSGEEGFWDVEEDVKLHYFPDGEGTNVLFLHGGPGFPVEKPPEGLKALEDGFRVLYYDQRGCGRSTRPFDRFTSKNYFKNMTTLEKTLGIGAQVADIERIRRILGEEDLILVGHSFGAFLAALYAAEFPERVKAMVLVSPANVLVMPQEDGGLYEEVEKRLPDAMLKEYAEYLKDYFDYGDVFSKSEADLAELNGAFARYYAAALKDANLSLPEEHAATNNGGWMVQAMYFSMGRGHDYRDALKNVQAPVLVLHGEKDLQPEKASRMYADALPNSDFHTIPDAGHFAFTEQPEEFAKAAGEFLRKNKGNE